MKRKEWKWTGLDTTKLIKSVAEACDAEYDEEEGRYYFAEGTSVPFVVGYCLGKFMTGLERKESDGDDQSR